jgi:hypothetical protein
VNNQSRVASPTNYGAVEIIWQNPIGFTAAGTRFNFIVSAQIDIFRGRWAQTDSGIQPASPREEKVATIHSFYPVDVFFTNSVAGFEPRWIYTNWPKQVSYDPNGYNPKVWGLRPEEDALMFRYGEHARDELQAPPSLTPVNRTP